MAWGDRAAEQYEQNQPTEARIPTPEEHKLVKAALIRAYALGHAHARERVNPNTEDWRLARSWYGHGDAPKTTASPTGRERTRPPIQNIPGSPAADLEKFFEHPYATPAETVLDAEERRGD